MSVDEGVTRLDRDKKLKIAQKQSSGMGRRPGTAAATGARQRNGKEERRVGGRGVGDEGMGGSEEDESAGASGAPHPAELRVPARRPEAMTRAGAVRRGAAQRGASTPGRGDWREAA